VRSLVVTHKWSVPTHGQPRKKRGGPLPEIEKWGEEAISHHLSSLVPQRAERFAELIRGHWGGCEIRNHWVRDELFEEDATRSKVPNLNGNLAVLRCSLIALKSRHAADHSWPAIFELSGMRPGVPYNLIANNAFK